MTDESRQEAVKVFLTDALDREPSERIRFAEASISDPSIRAEVIELLAALDGAGDFMSDPCAGVPNAPCSGSRMDGENAVGLVIGRYELAQLIGEGGFGQVYRAKQREPVIREVALKIIKLGMDTGQVIARFEAERQVLAMMKHPGIASVFDAGATTTGRPYFVMEFVDGVSITEYCDQHKLTIEERLRLFIDVCGAVQHAHTKGVIHRDLKPSNLLVTVNDGSPLPKVIDFGIAKATSGQFADFTISSSREARLIGTPQYMSPEQADIRALDVDTRSDVYSLGVVLYELLVGEPPFDQQRLQSSSMGEWQRIIREEEPPKPSTRLSSLDTLPAIAAHRTIESRRLLVRVSGDLDWITLKALDKDRDRRYGSAAALADDLRRHLRHEPVLATPPRVVYRTRKFVRRHRLGVVAAGMVTLAVVGGTVGTVMGMLRARNAAQRAADSGREASAINDFMRDVLTGADADRQGADTRLVEVLDEASAAASQRFAGQPSVEARVRDLLGGVYSRLAMWPQAQAESRKAVALWHASAGPDDPSSLISTLRLANVAVNLEQGREAERLLEGVMPRLERALGPDHPEVLEGQSIVAGMLRLRGRLDEGEQVIQDALQRTEMIGGDATLKLRLLNTLMMVHRNKIPNDGQSSARIAAMDRCRQTATELLEQCGLVGAEGNWHSYGARWMLAELAYDQEQYEEAAAQCRMLLSDSTDVLTECQNFRVDAMRLLADATAKLGETKESADLYLRLLECVRGYETNAARLIVSLTDALYHLHKDNRWSEGEACARELIQAVQAQVNSHVGTTYAEAFLAYFLSRQGRLDEAEQQFQALLPGYETANPTDRAVIDFAYGLHLVNCRQFEQAEQRLRNLIPEIDPQNAAASDHPDDYLLAFVELYQAWDKPEKAIVYRRLCKSAVDRQ